jgi:alpha-glucosidase
MMKTAIRRGSLALTITVSAVAHAAAQWASLGAMPAPSRQQNTLLFKSTQSTIAITSVTPEIVRVRFSASGGFGRDHSYAVVPQEAGDPRATFELTRGRSIIRTAAVQVTIRHAPFRIAFADASGNSLDEDDPEKGLAFSGRTVRVWKRLADEEHVYGFGEKTGRLDKRGWQLGGYSFAMWNSDTYGYDSSTDPIYAAVPFFMVVKGGTAHGIFLDSTFRSTFDVGRESQQLLSFGTDGGQLDYYFIYGPTPKDVVTRYTQLTGRMPLPPRWALGYHQCRYSYYPDRKVRFIAENFRVRRIPADTIWLDIHYQDSYKPFTWDPIWFPDPARLVTDLRKEGFRLVTIVDPHPKKEVGYQPYDSGLAGGHFVKKPDGAIYEAAVWPSQAERNPGPSVFPDFSRPATRDWWGTLYRGLVDIGIAGIWNDMNEPAVFDTASHTMPLDVRHDNEGQPTDHREIHNVYGMLMSRATFEGLLKLRPGERPFVLTRATFAGGQRYAAVWPGDNVSDWAHLRATIPMLAGMGLSGLPFVGSDIGGFADAPTAELYTRWLQTGVFYPFMRTHTTFGTPDQEPWSYGPYHETLNRRAIELRYELLPYIYNVMHEASATGIPAFRPLVLEYPGDDRTYQLDDQFMFGSDLLVAPVLREAVTEREVYLPKGDWYDFWTGQRQAGGASIRVPVTLASIPIFVKEGAFIFQQPSIQHTGEMSGQPLRVTVFPAARSERVLYEDDGQTREYLKGVWMTRRFVQQRSRSTQKTEVDVACTIDIEPAQGTFRPASRDLVLSIRWDGDAASVAAGPISAGLGGGSALQRFTAEELVRQTSGWTISNGFVVVKQRDGFEGLRVRVER